MMLDENQLDRFGVPQVKFDVGWRDNELKMVDDAVDQAVKMLTAAGCTDIEEWTTPAAPGTGIHEMGTARMGNDPRESVVNRWNQLHDAPNLFVTDGAAMTSASCVNPSLSYMAFTARAANHAVELLKANQI
jgi:choline dehydrogenase-like flavoprotein